MSMNDDYRTRAKVVRQAARDHLQAIRKARLSRTEPVATAGRTLVLPLPAAMPAEDFPFPVSPEIAAFATTQTNPTDSVEPTDAASDTAVSEGPAPTPANVSPPRKKARKAPQPKATPAPAVGEAPEPVEYPGLVAVASQPPQTEPVKDEANPAPKGLMSLPGAGEGLVWMLGQCGVHSLSDLAACDPADLGRKLGLVGRILNVDSWVEFARSQSR